MIQIKSGQDVETWRQNDISPLAGVSSVNTAVGMGGGDEIAPLTAFSLILLPFLLPLICPSYRNETDQATVEGPLGNEGKEGKKKTQLRWRSEA